MDRRLCIFGTGGCGRETLCCIIDSVDSTDFDYKRDVVFMVDDEHYSNSSLLDVEVMPRSAFNPENFDVVIGVGDSSMRKKIAETLPHETRFKTIIHPSVVMSKWVELGEGAIITAGCILTTQIIIGKHAHLNLGSRIGHDCVIGDYFTTAFGVKVSGNCTISDLVYLGTNVSIKQGISITEQVTIGMGGVVVKHITESGVYIGNPVQKMLKK